MKRITAKKIVQLALLLAITAAPAAAQLEIERTVVSAGAVRAAATGIRLSGTIGQSIVGRSGNGTTSAWLGFWTPRTTAPQVSSVALDATRIGAMQIAPNICSAATTIVTPVASPGPVTITIVDGLGRTVMNAFEGDANGSVLTIPVDVSRLEAGRYFALVVTAQSRQQASFIVAR